MTIKPLRPFFSYLGSKWRLTPKYPHPEGFPEVNPDNEDGNEIKCPACGYVLTSS